MNILIVDDEDDTRSYLKALLTAAGHHITGAATGIDAILQVELQRYDLVLLDLMMPGINGFQFAEFMSSHWNTFETVVIAMSCRADPESKSLATVLGCAGYLEKPFNSAELFDVISEVQNRLSGVDLSPPIALIRPFPGLKH